MIYVGLLFFLVFNLLNYFSLRGLTRSVSSEDSSSSDICVLFWFQCSFNFQGINVFLSNAHFCLQVDEIPEETLPEPFSQSKQDLHSNMIKDSTASPTETSCDALMEQPQAVASHLPRNFQRRFSQKNSGEPENRNKKPPSLSWQLSDPPVGDTFLSKSSSNEEVVATVASSPVKFSTSARLPLSPPPATPVKKTDSTDYQDFCSMKSPDIQATPAKLAFSPASLMTVTPSLQPPNKRSLISPDDDSTNSPKKLVRRSTRFRSLKFDTPVKAAKIEEDINEKGSTSVDGDIVDILPESLLQSVCTA